MRRALSPTAPWTGQRRAAWILAGLTLGQFVVVPIVDRLLGGPGPFALFGL